MAYTDKAYFRTKLKEDDINLLIEDTAGQPQDEYLSEAIAGADDLIDSYLINVAEDLPLADPPPVIRQYSYYIALYYLHDRIQYNDIPERVKDNYDLAINWLKDVASGKATVPGLPEPEADATESNFIEYTVNAPNFGKDTM